MKIKITEVGREDAHFSMRKKFLNQIGEVNFKNIINWKDGWFGMENVTFPDGQKQCFHQIKFEELK